MASLGTISRLDCARHGWVLRHTDINTAQALRFAVRLFFTPEDFRTFDVRLTGEVVDGCAIAEITRR